MILSSADILQVIGGDAMIRYLAKVQIVDGKPAITGEEGLFIYIDRFPVEREFEAVWKLWVMDYSGEPVDLVLNRIKILLPSVQIFERALGYEIESTDFKYESTQTKPAEKELSLPDLSSYEDRFKALSESIEDRMLTVFDGQPGRDGKDGKDGVDGQDGKDLDATEVDLGDLADVELQSYLTLEKGHVLTWDGDRWTNLFVPQVFNTGRGSEGSGGGGISDAPANNVPYVRYNNTWISWAEARDITAQLADIVDGGDFDQNLSTTSTNTIYDGGDFEAGTSTATDQEVIDGGEFTPEQDTILDGGIATL